MLFFKGIIYFFKILFKEIANRVNYPKLGESFSRGNIIQTISVLFASNQLIYTFHRVAHIRKTVLVILFICNSAFSESVKAFTLANSEPCLFFIFRNIIQHVKS